MKITSGIAAIVLLFAQPSIASAQSRAMGTFRGYLTGHLGGTTGGSVSDSRMTPGLSVSVQEQDGWGAEFDFGHADDAEAGAQELDITTYMVNVSWIRPVGSIRPFGFGGGGVMQIEGCAAPCNRDTTTHDFGLSAGGGVVALINDMLAVRGDARYFFSSADHTDLGRPDRFSFWRISAGVTFMWTILP